MIRRREFIAGLGSAAAWPAVARAQQRTLPVVAFLRAGSDATKSPVDNAFYKGLGETNYVDGRSVTVEPHWLEGQYDRLPRLVADLLARRVTVIATPGLSSNLTTIIAKTVDNAIPIVFGLGTDPVKLGLVKSLARPGVNVTGVNFFVNEVVAKRFGLLHEMVPRAVRIGVIVNPNNPVGTESTLEQLREAARVIGLQIQIVKAGTIRDIDAAFETLVREHSDALLVGPDAFFSSRRVQFATLSARHAIPASYSNRTFPEVGGLMSYGTDLADMFRQAGVYTGQILQGNKPADLPVVQSTRFEFVINVGTARALGIAVPPTMLALADEVID
jgi:putative ABC transport system substrate-binding protein